MNIKLLGFLLFLGSVILGGCWWYIPLNFSKQTFVELSDGFVMRTCKTETEKDFIRKQFKDNWSNLISSPNYDIEYFLNERGIYPFQPEYAEKMQIKILYKNDTKVGFCAYYMKTPTEGSILFIAVDKDHRGKRYAEQLVRYATNDLKRLGAQFVRFSTGANNTSAQKLYDRLGYQRIPTDSGHVGYRFSFS